ncbi:MAG: ankyrin repeat domain-containing protein [Spirochaetia bacterium]
MSETVRLNNNDENTEKNQEKTVRLEKSGEQSQMEQAGGTVRLSGSSAGNTPDQGTVRLGAKGPGPKPVPSPGGTVRIGSKDASPQDGGSGTVRIGSTGENFQQYRQNQMLGKELSLNGTAYTISKVISEGKTGEADIYLVENTQKQCFIYKKYKRDIQVKESVLQTVKDLENPHVIKLIDYGMSDEGFFELMEFAAGGTIADRMPIKDTDTFKELVRQCSHALYHCHQKGLVHRDIKPENMFLKSDGDIHILIADFGIASMVDLEMERKVTSRNLTFQYAAPETLTFTMDNSIIIGPPVDYFALGLSLITLWLGADWFEDLPFGVIPTVIVQGDFEIPDDMPGELKDCVQGFLAHNPADRWTYEEVQRWLAGEKVPVARIASEQEKGLEKFDFIKIDGELKTASTMKEMADLLFQHKEQGAKFLYNGDIANWIKPADRLTAVEIEDIASEYPKEKGKTDSGILKAIYLLDPQRGFIDRKWAEHPLEHGTDIEEVLDQIGNVLDDEVLEVAETENQNDTAGKLKHYMDIQRKKNAKANQPVSKKQKNQPAPKSGKPASAKLNAELESMIDASVSAYLTGDLLKVYLEANGQNSVYEEIYSDLIKPCLSGKISKRKAFMKLVLLLQKGDTFRYMGTDYESFDQLKDAGRDVHEHLAKEVHRTDSKFLCWLEEMYLKSDSNDISQAETFELLELIKEMPWLKDYDKQLSERLNKRDESGYTDLMKMAKAGDLAACKELVKNGADLAAKSPSGWTAFAVAAFAGQVPVMEYLKDQGAELDLRDNANEPLIHQLVHEGKEQAVGFLLENGVSPDTLRKEDNWTPLMVAAGVGEVSIAQMLLQAGADPNKIDTRDIGALHTAAGDNDTELMQLLIDHGADVNLSVDVAFTPLHLAARDNRTEAVKLLIEKGADVNAGAEKNWTPLHPCGETNSLDAVKILLDAGADPDVGIHDYQEFPEQEEYSQKSLWPPPVYFALIHGSFEMARLLAEKGASMEFNEVGRNYVHIICDHSSEENQEQALETLKFFLQKGADPNKGEFHSKEKESVSPPLAYAVWNNRIDIAKILLQNGAKTEITFNTWSLVNQAAAESNREVLQLLLEHGADPDVPNGDNQTALHSALYQENVDPKIIEILLKHGADPYVNDRFPDNAFYNPFCAAATTDNPELVKLFVKYGAKAGKAGDENKLHWNPLFWAINFERNENLEIIAKTKSGLEYRDVDGFTPLMFAAYQGNEKAVDILLKYGANPLAESNNGNTAAEVAVGRGFSDLGRHILKKGRVSAGPAAVIAGGLKIIAALLGLYTFAWSGANRFFLPESLAFYYPVGAAFAGMNVWVWYLYFSKVQLLRNRWRHIIKTVLYSGVFGVILFTVLNLQYLVSNIPFVSGLVPQEFYGNIPVHLVDTHLWQRLPSAGLQQLTGFVNTLPFGQGITASHIVLIISGVILGLLLPVCRAFSKKVRRIKRIFSNVR